MDQHMKLWLQQNGHHNVFAFYTEQQCQELVSRLEAQLAAEQQLEQAAREVVMHSQLALQYTDTTDDLRPHDTTAWMNSERKEPEDPPAHTDGQTNTRSEPIIAEPNESTEPYPTVSARHWGFWLPVSAGLLGLLGIAVWSAVVYQFAFRKGKQQQAHTITASQCNTSPAPMVIARHTAASGEPSTTIMPSLSAPLLIQPALRVELSSAARANFPWKALSSASQHTWKAQASHEPIISAELSQSLQPTSNDAQWVMPSVSRFRLNKGHFKRPRQREFFRLPPLRLTKTTF